MKLSFCKVLTALMVATGLHRLEAQTPPAQNPAPAVNSNEAQAPGAAPYTIRSTTRLVILDLVVTDAQGNVMHDLTRNDFRVQESGEHQTVLNFEPLGAHVVDTSLNINSTADLDRLAPRAPSTSSCWTNLTRALRIWSLPATRSRSF